MPYTREECATCKYYSCGAGAEWCRRYPESTSTYANNFCGEWIKEERLSEYTEPIAKRRLFRKGVKND